MLENILKIWTDYNYSTRLNWQRRFWHLTWNFHSDQNNSTENWNQSLKKELPEQGKSTEYHCQKATENCSVLHVCLSQVPEMDGWIKFSSIDQNFIWLPNAKMFSQIWQKPATILPPILVSWGFYTYSNQISESVCAFHHEFKRNHLWHRTYQHNHGDSLMHWQELYSSWKHGGKIG